MKQYSADRRERLLQAIDAGLSQAEASRIFGVGTSTTSRWWQRRRDRGDVTPRPGRSASIGPDDAEALRTQVAQHVDATLAEHCARWTETQGVVVSVPTMSRAIRRLGITVKKRPPRHRAESGAARRLARGARSV